jgi:hypothetical protein
MSQTRTNPFSAAPALDDTEETADHDLGDPRHLIECSCGRIHDSAREALNCTHNTNHE